MKFSELMACPEAHGLLWPLLTLDEAGAVRACDKALRKALPGAAQHGRGRLGLMAWWFEASAEQLRSYELRRLVRAFERLLRVLGADVGLFECAREEFGALSNQAVEAVQFQLFTPTSLVPCIAGRPMVQLSLGGVDAGSMTVFPQLVPHPWGYGEEFEFRPQAVDTERLDAVLRHPSMDALQFTRAWVLRMASNIQSNGADTAWLCEVLGADDGPDETLTLYVLPTQLPVKYQWDMM